MDPVAGGIFDLTGLPAAAKGPLRVMMPPKTAVSPKTPDPRSPVQRVLLADDDPVNRQLTARLLEARGCAVTVVDNGLDAVARHEQHPFDLVLLDVEMPALDGPGAAARIRAAEQATGDHVWLIAVTAHRRAEERDRCLAAGMDGYLTKPFEPNKLDRLLAGGKLERRYREAAPTSPAAVVDWRRALDSVNHDRALLERITASARRSVPERMDAVRRALGEGDPESARRAVHTLRGALRIFGALRARELALRLEQHAAQRQLDAAADLLEPLAWELESALEALAAGPPPAPPDRAE